MEIYVIEVSASTVNGTGMSASKEAKTDESIPEAPEGVNVTHRTESSLILVWEVPSVQNGIILEYQVNVTRVNHQGMIYLVMSVTLNDQTLNVTNLAPATPYNVSVAAKTIKGYGPSAMAVFSTRSRNLTINEVPRVSEILKDTVALVIKPVNLDSIPMSAYFILVKENLEKEMEKERRRKRRCTFDPNQSRRRRRCSNRSPEDQLTIDQLTVDYNTSRREKRDLYAAAKLLPDAIPSDGLTFRIGDGKMYNGYYNAPLTTGQKYMFGMAIVSTYTENPQTCSYFLESPVVVRSQQEAATATSPGLVVGMLFICLLAITAFLLFLYYKKPELFRSIKSKAGSSFHIMNNNNNKEELYSDCVPMKGAHSNRVAVADLETYVREGIESGKLAEEYQAISKGHLHSCDTARLPENKCKNRYGNLLPYDHSRVALTKIHNDEFSDYINASFIDGHKTTRKYVATQGPKPITIIDFWRMVWQLKVCKIAMVTNVLENGKVKCEKYWPDTTDRYGQLTIELKETNTYSDYVIRHFQVFLGEEMREVSQFHFTTWADHTVPMYPMSMGGFLKRLRAFKTKDKAPIVVHCSAGVGRTGTLILIDSMMDMAATENAVDLMSQLWDMRQYRINQVENVDQYVFAYQTLAEVLCGVETNIVCSEFYDEFTKMKKEDPKTGKSPLQLQFERLDKVRQPLKASECRIGFEPSNADKNRDVAVLPPDRSRPVLPVFQNENTSNYINAVFVNGFKQRDAFLVTQMPLAHTVSDFWRMLKSTRTRSIVLLQDGGAEQYWPTEGTVEHGALKVTTTSTEQEGNLTIRMFTIQGPGPKEEVTIKQFHFQSWPADQEIPSNKDEFLSLIETVERWQKNTRNRPVTVQCLNGVSASGVFCASVFVCDKIKSDQEVDVYLAVRSIRNNRPQFITNQAQYIFCHEMALTFLDSFETYANFQ